MKSLNISDKEREEIKKKHEEATKQVNEKKVEIKKGLQLPAEKKK